MMVSSSDGGIFKPLVEQKFRVLVVLSLLLTWWFAHLLPHFQPYITSRLDEARQKIPKLRFDWDPPDSVLPPPRYNASRAAVMIEPRPISILVPQILHMIMVVPSDWRFVFFGSKESVVAVGRAYAIRHQQTIGKLRLVVLPPPWIIDSKEMVFRMLTDLRFYDEFLPGVEWMLNYESDSVLCSNSASSLNDWLRWDWTGAPTTPDDRFAGKGGLSLRRLSTIRRVLSTQSRRNNTQPEDEWFGERLLALPGANVASGTANALTVEDVFAERPMGYHLRDGGKGISDVLWADAPRRSKMLEYCPELSLIADMKLKVESCG